MPGRINAEAVENTRQCSNIEKVMQSTADETLTEWRRAGAAESNRVQGIKRSVNAKLEQMLQTEDIPALMQTMLLGEVTPDQREYIRDLVPAVIKDEDISPLVAMTYATVDRAIRSGDAAAMEKILKMSGSTAELRVKLAVTEEPELDFTDLSKYSTEELRRFLARHSADIVDTGYEDNTDAGE